MAEAKTVQTKNIFFKVPEELYERLRRALFDKRATLTAFGNMAFERELTRIEKRKSK